MNEVVSRAKYWISINVLGIILYLYFSSKIWAPAGEKGLKGGPGDPFIWGLTALPVAAICALANLVRLILILTNVLRGRGWRPILVWLLVIFAWIGANRLDVSQRYDGSALQIDNQPISR